MHLTSRSHHGCHAQWHPTSPHCRRKKRRESEERKHGIPDNIAWHTRTAVYYRQATLFMVVLLSMLRMPNDLTLCAIVATVATSLSHLPTGFPSLLSTRHSTLVLVCLWRHFDDCAATWSLVSIHATFQGYLSMAIRHSKDHVPRVSLDFLSTTCSPMRAT